MLFYNCSKCGLCLSECVNFQKTQDENVSPKSLIIHKHFETERLKWIKSQCAKCPKKCIGLEKCPMGITTEELEEYLGCRL